MIPTPEIYLALAIAGFWVSSCSQYPIRENGEYPSQIYLESVLAACVPSAGLEDSVAMGASLRYGPSGKAALCLWLLAPKAGRQMAFCKTHPENSDRIQPDF